MEKIESKTKKVAVGLSGGVDSSVAALLLKQKGYDVTGVYLECWNEGNGCRAEADRADAVRVASQLGIPFLSMDLKKDYEKKVLNYFVEEYAKGRTPNPDVMCNTEIKFGIFYKKAKEMGFDYVATGHYAKIKKIRTSKGIEYRLQKGKDPGKDQSYFLYRLSESQLKSVLFPVGNMIKREVRKIAREHKLITAGKPDSQGVCFVGKVNMREFLKKRIITKEGPVVTKKGEIIGTHQGLNLYTIGQRHGFELKKYQGEPRYVVKKNGKRNELVVGTKQEAMKNNLKIEKLHWINPLKSKTFSCQVRIRHLGKCIPATIKLNTTRATIVLKNKAFGIAGGQSAVIYKKTNVLGGGIIKES